jgi:hypothetical protein
MLGYVADGTGGIRPILGIPGAALAGELQAWGWEASLAEISPGQDYALAVDPEGGVRRIELGGPSAQARAVDGAMRSPERILMGPGGRAALLVRGTDAQVIVGTAAPVAIDLSTLPGEPGVLAVSDSGAVLAAADGGLFLLSEGAMHALPSTGAVTAVAFTPDGRDALGAGPRQLSIIETIAGQPAWRVITALDEDFGTPIAVAGVKGRAIAAAARAVIVADLKNGAAVRLEGSITALARLNGDAFRLTAYSADPMWMLDTGGPPRLLFIPPAAPMGEEVAQ